MLVPRNDGYMPSVLSYDRSVRVNRSSFIRMYQLYMPCNFCGINMENIVLQEFTYLFRLYLVVKSALPNGWQKVKLGPVRVFINFRFQQITLILLNPKAVFSIVSTNARHRSSNFFTNHFNIMLSSRPRSSKWSSIQILIKGIVLSFSSAV
jgi:hypothetical protein